MLSLWPAWIANYFYTWITAAVAAGSLLPVSMSPSLLLLRHDGDCLSVSRLTTVAKQSLKSKKKTWSYSLSDYVWLLLLFPIQNTKDSREWKKLEINQSLLVLWEFSNISLPQSHFISFPSSAVNIQHNSPTYFHHATISVFPST